MKLAIGETLAAISLSSIPAMYIDKGGLLQVYSQHLKRLQPRVNKRFSCVDS